MPCIIERIYPATSDESASRAWMVDPPGGLHDTAEIALAWAHRRFPEDAVRWSLSSDEGRLEVTQIRLSRQHMNEATTRLRTWARQSARNPARARSASDELRIRRSSLRSRSPLPGGEG